MPTVPGIIDGGLSEQTALLRRSGQLDHTALRHIGQRLRPIADSTRWALAVDLTLPDPKQVTILRFLERCRKTR